MLNDLEKRKWDKEPNPAKHSPDVALRAVLGELQDIQPDHVIIFYGKRQADGSASYGYKQGGAFNDFEQAGLVSLVAKLMKDGD